MEIREEEKYLMFFLNDEFYGIPVLKINEIIGLMEFTRMPCTPDFMKGIINLRGKIIPIMDLRLKFKMDERPYDEQTCIIIVEIPIEGHKKLVGVVVDKVAEVVSIYKSDIETSSQYSQEGENNFLIGIGKVKDKIVMLLEIEAIVRCRELINLIKESQENLENLEGKKGKKSKEVAMV